MPSERNGLRKRSVHLGLLRRELLGRLPGSQRTEAILRATETGGGRIWGHTRYSKA